MKRFLPHFFYLTAIGGLAIFLWQRVERDKQMILFLNQPTGESVQTVDRLGLWLKKQAKRQAKDYPSNRSSEYADCVSRADSLLTESFRFLAGRDSLAAALVAMAGKSPRAQQFIKTVLLPEYPEAIFGDYRAVLGRTDTLRRKLACYKVLEYCSDDFRRISTGCAGGGVFVSHTTLFSPVGKPFQTDILFSSYASDVFFNSYARTDIAQVQVNGHPVALRGNLGRYRQVFPQAGLYPLKVKFTHQPWDGDSVIVSEKTFYLYVNR